ncbi:MAG: TonB family protein [Candidatus Nitrosoglobus sp.]
MHFPTLTSQVINYRLGLALLFSTLLHGVIILSISRTNTFSSPLIKNPPSMLEVTLVPQKPDFLTQAKATGERKGIVSPPPKTNAHSLLSPEAHPKPAAQSLPIAPVAATVEKKISAPKTGILTPAQTNAPRPIAQQQLSHPLSRQRQDAKLVPSPETVAEPASPRSRPSAQELIAALDQQLIEEAQGYANQPRKRYIDTSTKKYAATAYLDAWRKKIERIGKMSYPEEAKRQGLSGSLVLAVDLNADGTVADIVVRQSSGYKILDKAAVQIVHLAAPFAKVPETVLRGYDILSITRTWQFHSGKDFSSS